MKKAILLSLALVLTASAAARAQTPSADAEQLFRDAKKLMQQGKYADACTAFDTSQQLDPAVTTLANLADCREKNGQIATAWAHFLEVERQTRGDKKLAALNKAASDRATKLEPRLSYLTVSVPEESNINGLILTRNEAELASGLWNRAIPVDGGEYVITGHAPGHEQWSTTVTVPSEAGHVTVDVPKFKEAAVIMKEPEKVVVGDADRHVDPPVEVEITEPSGMSGKRKAAIGIGSVAVLGLGSAVVFELVAESNFDKATHEPDNGLQGKLTDKANLDRAIAIGAGIVGVVATGVAAYLWLTGGHHGHRRAQAFVVPTLTADSLGLAFTSGF